MLARSSDPAQGFAEGVDRTHEVGRILPKEEFFAALIITARRRAVRSPTAFTSTSVTVSESDGIAVGVSVNPRTFEIFASNALAVSAYEFVSSNDVVTTEPVAVSIRCITTRCFPARRRTLPLKTMRAPDDSPILFQSSGRHGSISSVIFPTVELTCSFFACVSAVVNASVTAWADFEVVERSSRSSNAVTTTECRASSAFWTIEDRRELMTTAVRPMPPRITIVASEPASFGLRFDQRQTAPVARPAAR